MGQLDQDEFATLFREAYAQLWTVAAAILGDRNRAEDVVQDAAMTGLRRIADYEPGTNFTAWMSQVVRFTALNYRKRKSGGNQETAGLHGVSEPEARSADTSAAVGQDGQMASDQQWFDDCTARALQDLEPDRRACLLLRVVHELGYDEIAAIVGVPPGTAMSHVHRAKAALRKQLAPALGQGSPGKEPADG